MTSLHRPEPKKASSAARYGPIAAVLVVVLVIAGVAISRRGSDPDTASTANGNGNGAATGSTKLPVQYNDAKAKNGDLSVYGDRCDPVTGRVKLPTVYAVPCVPEWKAGTDNGGATYPGVTGDTIKVVEYKAASNGDLAALLQGLQDSPEDTTATFQAYVDLFQDMSETYGRKVELVSFQSTSAMDDEVGGRADAVKIAEELGAFAVLGGPSQARSYAQELAARGVICLGCGLGVPDSAYQDAAPHVWGTLATPEQFLLNVGDLMGRLVGKNAEFAGDEALHDKKRVIGVVHYEQKVPVYTEVNEMSRAVSRSRGYEPAATETYILDLPKLPERATSIIAKMKDAGVTTIIFLGDPLMPMSLTKAATDANYFPEWVVTGTVLTDTNALARRYDPKQWGNAFGISSLGAKTPREIGDAWRLHEWFHGAPPAAKTTAPIIFSPVQMLFMGIHLAGPNLTPESFRDGMFSYPPSGGTAVSPRISFGERRTFVNPLTNESRPDFLGIDDVAVIWFDTEAEGKDESGAEGKGMYRYTENGARYLPGEMPTTDVPVGQVENTVTVLDEIPADQRAPDYPRPG